MVRLSSLLLVIVLLSGCFRLAAVEHTVYGGINRQYSGGQVYSAEPSGHEEQGGGWNVGSAVKTVWTP